MRSAVRNEAASPHLRDFFYFDLFLIIFYISRNEPASNFFLNLALFIRVSPVDVTYEGVASVKRPPTLFLFLSSSSFTL
jgi:hypothetical protein